MIYWKSGKKGCQTDEPHSKPNQSILKNQLLTTQTNRLLFKVHNRLIEQPTQRFFQLNLILPSGNFQSRKRQKKKFFFSQEICFTTNYDHVTVVIFLDCTRKENHLKCFIILYNSISSTPLSFNSRCSLVFFHRLVSPLIRNHNFSLLSVHVPGAHKKST